MGLAVMDLPPRAIYVAAEAAREPIVDSQRALKRLRASNPGTVFLSAEPSSVAGLIKLTLAGGKLAYADKSGRYLFMGVIFDMSVGKALDGALDATTQSPIGDFLDD